MQNLFICIILYLFQTTILKGLNVYLHIILFLLNDPCLYKKCRPICVFYYGTEQRIMTSATQWTTMKDKIRNFIITE